MPYCFLSEGHAPYHLRKSVRSALAREQSSLARGHAPYHLRKTDSSLQAAYFLFFTDGTA